MSARKFLAVVGVLAFLGGACVKSKEAEPGVRAITTDLQYKELQKKNAAPPNTVPAPIATIAPFETLPPFDNGNVGPVAPTSTCPTAAPTSQAQEDVTDLVSKLPETGGYLWRVAGSQKMGGGRVALPQHTTRKIENVQGSMNGNKPEFTFVTEEKELSTSLTAATVKSTFQVTSKTATDNTVRQQGQSSGRTATSGVRLTRVEREVPGQAPVTFVPSSPIRYLITPVIVGESRFWMDQVVDVSSGTPQTLTHRAFVLGRKTIDACGQRIRGWLVVADQTYQSGADRVTRHFEYAVATQLGGIVIFEDVKSPCTYNNGKCDEGQPDLSYQANYGKKT